MAAETSLERLKRLEVTTEHLEERVAYLSERLDTIHHHLQTAALSLVGLAVAVSVDRDQGLGEQIVKGGGE